MVDIEKTELGAIGELKLCKNAIDTISSF